MPDEQQDAPQINGGGLLGLTFSSGGRHDAAVICYQQALRLKPDYFDAHLNLGNALAGLNRAPEAEASFRLASQLRPNEPVPLKLIGMTLARRDKFSEAAEWYRRAIAVRPDFAEAHNDLGIVLARGNDYEGAVAAYRGALRHNPKFAEAYNNLGNALRNLGRFEESADACREAIKLKPEYADAHNNLGITMAECGRFAEAVASYSLCIGLQPKHIDAHLNRALTWLRAGNFAQGWAEYEWRWKKRSVSNKPLAQPYWNGFPLAGRKILLITEQGLGDTIQFIRFAAVLKRQGATVILECPERLMKLLARFPEIDQIVPQGQPHPEHDFHVPMVTIPGLVGTTLETIPAEIPYLKADPALVQRWRCELEGIREFKVGINWQGNPKYGGDRHRSIPLARFEPLARIPGVRLFSLQKNFGSEQLQELNGRFQVADLGSRMDETTGPFMDTAAVMTNLDLIITSDTAVVHLAGALGVKVWVALSATPGWQWLADREDTPWYPTMRLFRQERILAWEPVFERIARELGLLVRQSSRAHAVSVGLSPDELFDRITSLEIEAGRVEDPARLSDIRAILAELTSARDRTVVASEGLGSMTAELWVAHATLRRVEEELQICEQSGDFGPRFVELARSGRDAEARRAKARRDIATLIGSIR